MKSERRIRFMVFVVCLVAAIPYAQGQVGLEDVTLEPSASLEGVKIDALNVGVTLCHIPPGDPANAQTIVDGQAAVAAHFAHGDYLGECQLACSGFRRRAEDRSDSVLGRRWHLHRLCRYGSGR
jgi:hypothetical protein